MSMERYTNQDKRLDPITPGEILLEEFLKPSGLNAAALAKALDVPAGRISEIINGRRIITADTALRLGRFFGNSPEVWTGLQTSYELRVAQLKIGQELEKIRPLNAA